MAQIAGLMSKLAGRPVSYVPITPEQRREEMLAAGAPPYFADALFEQAVERLRNPVAAIHLDSHREFDVRPTTFTEFLERNASAF
jgi:hypothetical protein